MKKQEAEQKLCLPDYDGAALDFRRLLDISGVYRRFGVFMAGYVEVGQHVQLDTRLASVAPTFEIRIIVNDQRVLIHQDQFDALIDHYDPEAPEASTVIIPAIPEWCQIEEEE